jgi:endonuclease/exonuclease/phosphatase (EEP) superfamily protein YafD
MASSVKSDLDRGRKFSQYAVWAIGAVVLVIGLMTTAGFIGKIWLCDMCSQFRLIYLVALLLCATASLLFRAYRLLVVCLLMVTVISTPLLVLLAPSKSAADNGQSDGLRIMNFNTEFQHNDNYQSFSELVRQVQPDLLALVEVDKKWIDNLPELNNRFAYRKVVLEGPGMALYSRYPIKQVEVRHYGKSHHPRILATIVVGNHAIDVLIVHPTTPQSDRGFNERNSEIAVIADELRSMNNPKFLIGDLNCGPWSSHFASLLSLSGLTDSEQGFGVQPSWPARTGRVIANIPVPPLIPIDHVLVSQDVGVIKRELGPPLGSDHLPVIVQCTIH